MEVRIDVNQMHRFACYRRSPGSRCEVYKLARGRTCRACSTPVQRHGCVGEADHAYNQGHQVDALLRALLLQLPALLRALRLGRERSDRTAA